MPKTGDEESMDTHPEKQLGFHFDVLPKATRKALDYLSEQAWLRDSSWYLAGGTALALQAGHRCSVDLDFFCQDKDMESDDLMSEFSGIDGWKVTLEKKNTLYGELFKAKISFIAYPFFVPKQEFIRYGSVRMLDKRDIAVMKIIAISQRGRKRDFFDLYWCAYHIEPLENIVKRLKSQYPSVAHDYHHILKALVYFADAESDPEPETYFTASWKSVKKFFREEVSVVAKRLIV